MGGKQEEDLLGSRLSPVGEKLLASSSVVVGIVLVADGTNGDSLDESATGQEVKDLPDELAGPEEVAWEGLALAKGALALGALGGGILVVSESEERDVGELEVGQVGEDVVGELESGGLLDVGNGLSSGGDVAGVSS